MNHADPSDARCPWSDEVLAHALGEPAGRDRAAVDAHVAGCADCAQLRRDFDQVSGALRALPSAPAPDVADVVVAMCAKTPLTERGYIKLFALAAALLLAFLAWWQLAGPATRLANRTEPEAAAEVLAGAPAPATAPNPAPVAPPPGTPAVARAVDWLIAAQEAQGSWSAARWGAQSNYTVGVTALALLALLSSETAAAPARTDAVGRAAGYLASQQDARGLFGPAITGSLYNHALACLALMDARVGPPERLRDALALLAHAQHADGGWSYLRAPTGPANSSLTVWALLALSRAEELGLRPHDETVPRGLAWLESTISAEGRVGYRKPGDYPRGPETLTAAAAVCLLDQPSVDRSRLGQVLNHIRRDVAQPLGAPDSYRTYFQAVALREAGFGDSEEVARLEQQLSAGQEQAGDTAGSWPAQDQWARAGGRVYTTALAVLALQER